MKAYARAREAVKQTLIIRRHSASARPTPDAFLQPRVMMLSAGLYRVSKKLLNNALARSVARGGEKKNASRRAATSEMSYSYD